MCVCRVRLLCMRHSLWGNLILFWADSKISSVIIESVFPHPLSPSETVTVLWHDSGCWVFLTPS